jgi:hypothetical protein
MIEIGNFDQFDAEMNEMAFKNPITGKIYPKGEILKCTHFDSDTSANGRTFKWADMRPLPGLDGNETKFFFEVTGNSTKFINGRMLYMNCATNSYGNFRMHGRNAELPGKVWDIISPKRKDIDALRGKVWFMHGDEDQFLDLEGKAIKISEGNYTFNGLTLNFGLTKQFNEPVLVFVSQKSAQKGFCIKLSDVDSLSKELSPEQNETIADWFIENTDMNVRYAGGSFYIKRYVVVTKDPDEDFVITDTTSYKVGKNVAGPFVRRSDAENVLKVMKEVKGVSLYDKKSLEVSVEQQQTYGRGDVESQMTLEALVNFVRANGIEVEMRSLLKGKENEAALKGLGF